MNFSNVLKMAIPEGRIRRIYVGEKLLWGLPKNYTQDIYALATNNWWVNTSGGHSATDKNWISADYIAASAGSVVKFGLLGHTSIATVAAYDTNKKVIGYAKYAGGGTQGWFEGEYILPDDTAFITITGCTETYRPVEYQKQYATLTSSGELNEPRHYIEDGQILWCDGRNNSGDGHDETTTTWKDLSGNDNDILNTADKTATRPATSVQGVWLYNGMSLVAKNNQFLRTVGAFDLGADRTLEVRFTLLEDKYATFGFATGDRYKYRITSSGAAVNDWVRLSASDVSNVISLTLSKSATVGVPSTMSITRRYDAEANTTNFIVYLDGVQVVTRSMSGNHRANETSPILLGNEQDVAVFHSVRLYNRALSANEVAYNYQYDRLRFA